MKITVSRIIFSAVAGRGGSAGVMATNPGGMYYGPKDRMGQRTFSDDAGENMSPGLVRGIDFIRDPRMNKGMAFTLEERQKLGLHGMLPPRFKTQEEQVALCLNNIKRYGEPINKFIYLMGLQDRNERLFYRLLCENVEDIMPIVYTPTVGLACQKFGLIYRRPRGLFITIYDKGHIYDVLKNWPEVDVRTIVVTDGERILGLGDLGAYGMGIPVGKLSLYVALAGIKPQHCLPIVLDVGTNNQASLDDEFYIGLRQKRVTGPEYDEFIDEFMEAVVRRYGQDTLVQFEDFGNKNAHRLLMKYRENYCTFNDDIQGTASVAVAGIIASTRITKKRISDNIVLLVGAGEANLGIADLCVMAMAEEGTCEAEARSKIFMTDSKGLIVKDRPSGGLNAQKLIYAKEGEPETDLHKIVKRLKPSIIVGASAQPNTFTPELIQDMAANNERPVIFALSNPTSKAECTAEEAYKHSDGRAVFASGSPFPMVEHNGQIFFPGQGNNAYIFPGVGLGVQIAGIRHVSDKMFLLASQTLAAMVTEKNLESGRVYPPLADIRNVSVQIALKIVEYAYEQGIASTYPEPKDKLKFINSQLYNYNYPEALPVTYSWPQEMMTN